MRRLDLDSFHDMTQISLGFDDVAIVTVAGNDYRINYWFMIKSEAMNRMKNTDTNEKNVQLS